MTKRRMAAETADLAAVDQQLALKFNTYEKEICLISG